MASWPLCTAFQLDELVFANISEGPNGPPEFAVLRWGKHIATLALARLSHQIVSQRLDQLFEDTESLIRKVSVTLEPAEHHRCSLCAE